MRRPDARSAQIGGPDCIPQCFQVSSYSGEPNAPILARNLLSKDNWRLALGDKSVELGPQMALVGGSATLAGGAEGLTGAAPGPDGAGPAGEIESIRPASNTREEMTLTEADKITPAYVGDAALIDFSSGEVAAADKLAEPCGGTAVNLVVVDGGHGLLPQGA